MVSRGVNSPFTKSRHFDDIAGIASESPSGLRVHAALELRLPIRLSGDIMRQHDYLQVLGR